MILVGWLTLNGIADISNLISDILKYLKISEIIWRYQKLFGDLSNWNSDIKKWTSNGSWCMGIHGEMPGTVCVTFTSDMYIWVVYSFCLFCCLFIIVTRWYVWCIVSASGAGLGSIQFRNWNCSSIPIPIRELELELKMVELKMELELNTLELELKTRIEFFVAATTALTSQPTISKF